MKVNEDKNSHRSPYTGILWPSNTKNYIIPRVLELERDFNIFLAHFQKIYYPDGTVSGFVKEFKDRDISINIGVYKKKENATDNFVLNCNYKVFFAVTLSQTEGQKANAVSIKQNSCLTYNVSFEFPKLHEKTSFSGQMNLQNSKSEFDHHDNLHNDYIIEIVGNLFEKCDAKLRRKLRMVLNDALTSKLTSFNENLTIQKENISKINDDLRKLQDRFVEDEKISQYMLKLNQAN